MKKTYQTHTKDGTLQVDAAQGLAIERLEQLANQLAAYKRRSWVARWFKRQAPPKGLYLYGGVGRGKSMLMDLFFTHLPACHKRRVHFHAFMQECHKKLFHYRELKQENPVTQLADDIADQCHVLCFDEFHVTDIADAMLLGRLLEQLFAREVVIVATSNFHPNELYRNGLNRHLFLPFIDLLQTKMDLLHLESGIDYRRIGILAGQRFLSPLGPETNQALNHIWHGLIGNTPETPLELHIQGRLLRLPRHAHRMVRSSFANLCYAALAAGDYLALVAQIDLLILEDIPIFKTEDANALRRFITLVDVLYEHKKGLICSAQTGFDDLIGFAGGDELFVRTQSRLEEMGSRDYKWP